MPSKPALSDLAHGIQGWDATLNNNNAILRDGPLPIKEYATTAAFPAAALYQGCAVICTADGKVYVSDGVTWIQVGGGGGITPGAFGGTATFVTNEQTITTNSGFTKQGVTLLVPAGALLFGVTGSVVTAITGPATFLPYLDTAPSSSNGEAAGFRGSKSGALGTTFGPADMTIPVSGTAAQKNNVWFPQFVKANLFPTVNSGGSAFSAGVVRFCAIYMTFTPPTS